MERVDNSQGLRERGKCDSAKQPVVCVHTKLPVEFHEFFYIEQCKHVTRAIYESSLIYLLTNEWAREGIVSKQSPLQVNFIFGNYVIKFTFCEMARWDDHAHKLLCKQP